MQRFHQAVKPLTVNLLKPLLQKLIQPLDPFTVDAVFAYVYSTDGGRASFSMGDAGIKSLVLALRALPQDLQDIILRNGIPISMAPALLRIRSKPQPAQFPVDILVVLVAEQDKRKAMLFPDVGDVPNEILDLMLTPPGILVLYEELMTLERALKIKKESLSLILDVPECLEKKLISPEQLAVLKLGHLQRLIMGNGKKSLLLKHFTVQQVIDNNMQDKIPCMTTNEGFKVLNRKLMTLEQMAVIPTDYLEILFTTEGLDALCEKLIEPEQIPLIKDVEILNAIVDSIASLREGRFTMAQALEANDYRDFKRLLEPMLALH